MGRGMLTISEITNMRKNFIFQSTNSNLDFLLTLLKIIFSTLLFSFPHIFVLEWSILPTGQFSEHLTFLLTSVYLSFLKNLVIYYQNIFENVALLFNFYSNKNHFNINEYLPASIRVFADRSKGQIPIVSVSEVFS